MTQDIIDLSGGENLIFPTGSAAITESTSFIPVAEPIATAFEFGSEFTPNPERPIGHEEPFPFPQPQPQIPLPRPFPWPGPGRFCSINLRRGCYRITFTPGPQFPFPFRPRFWYEGTMRVDTTTMSGDLYLQQWFPIAVRGPVFQALYDIQIYPRHQYFSYLRVINVQKSPLFTTRPCQLTLTAEEYVYTQPPAGAFNGTFPPAPGTRTVTIILEPKVPPPGYTSRYFEGKLYESGVERGTFTMGWVSSFMRKATLEIDTLVGAVAPAGVLNLAGTGTEDFRTVFASAGWDLNVIYNQTNIPVPIDPATSLPVNPNSCWSDANLHALMLTVRDPATNLDSEWRTHLVVVPATMRCGRGIMYDVIGAPREGAASFSDDGYDTPDVRGNTHTYGTAANQQQRNVARAFLRSACHEVGHAFNQIHQEFAAEAGADNSIMSTTPTVADVLGGPTTGAPGVFPNDINLSFNAHVQHHLKHLPDIAVRPGGMSFLGDAHLPVPQADRDYVSQAGLELRLQPVATQIELAEPLRLAWTLLNSSQNPVRVPSDIQIEAQHTFITVTDSEGRSKIMRSFIIQTEAVSIQPIDAGQALHAETRVFWSSNGFAFPKPGKYNVQIHILWSDRGVPYGVQASTDIWVNYPELADDNDAAANLLHPEVGMYVALKGAPHLVEAVTRLERVVSESKRRDVSISNASGQSASKVLRGYEGILPDDIIKNRRNREQSPNDQPPRSRPKSMKAKKTRKKTRR